MTTVTEKELHRLSRQDLLQLLLAQSKEVSRQRAAIEELKSNAEKDHELIDRLKGKLDDKDASLETLKHRLDEKDETIAHLKRRLDAKDETMNKLKADAEDMSGTMEFLRSRLDEKDIALDAARARLDMLSGVSAPPVRSGAADTDDRTMASVEERLKALKKQLAQAESAAAAYRKEEA